MFTDLLNMLDKAIRLYDEGSDLLAKVQPSLDNIKKGTSTDLEDAQDRLRKALDRAHEAHDTLEASIAQQIGSRE